MRPPARVDVILARRSPRAVVFRRGPSKWTLVLLWDTENDTFVHGDWFRGRIYTRRCDLTPDGRHLVYFAAKHGSRLGAGDGVPRRLGGLNLGYAWTAISEAPALEPLGAWVKDDCWHGGGLFPSDQAMELNERPGSLTDSIRRHRFQISGNPQACGEDEPIYSRRLERDGWTTTQEITWVVEPSGFTTTRAQLRRRAQPVAHGADRRPLWLEASWEIERFRSIRTWSVTDYTGTRRPIPGATWADWDQQGRLVAAVDGRIGTVWLTNGSPEFEELVDLNLIDPPELDRRRGGSPDA